MSLRWADEDKSLTAEIITKNILLESMTNIEDFLKFTIESGEDFDAWLPTLDTAFRVDENNKIQFKFYEKPEAAKKNCSKIDCYGRKHEDEDNSQ